MCLTKSLLKKKKSDCARLFKKNVTSYMKTIFGLLLKMEKSSNQLLYFIVFVTAFPLFPILLLLLLCNVLGKDLVLVILSYIN